jgi:hypothetical protein
MSRGRKREQKPERKGDDAPALALVPIVAGESLDAWFVRYLRASAQGDEERHLAGFYWGKWLSSLVGSRAAAAFKPEEIESLRRTVRSRARSQEEASHVWAVLSDVDRALALATKTKPTAEGLTVTLKAPKARPQGTTRERDPVDEAAWLERLKKTWLYK